MGWKDHRRLAGTVVNHGPGCATSNTGQAIDHGCPAVEHQPGDAGLLRGLEDRGQIRLRRDAVARNADVDDAAGIGWISTATQADSSGRGGLAQPVAIGPASRWCAAVGKLAQWSCCQFPTSLSGLGASDRRQ
jgi:hypothetical protein